MATRRAKPVNDNVTPTKHAAFNVETFGAAVAAMQHHDSTGLVVMAVARRCGGVFEKRNIDVVNRQQRVETAITQ
jgi:hypothetical protein